MISVVWGSDLHLNFCGDPQVEEFVRQTGSLTPDIIILTGDIAESQTLEEYLNLFEALPSSKTFFVLGNHDFYESSYHEVCANISLFNMCSKNAKWLTLEGVVKLSDDVALIGNDGWYDGRNGNYFGSNVELADFYYIREFKKSRGKEFRLRVMQGLADRYREDTKRDLQNALAAGFKNIIFATHVPPYAEAAWHMGASSNPDWQPFFSNRMGDDLNDIMDEHPECKLHVLCGHSHSSGRYQPRPNIIVDTAAAKYSSPAARIVELF
jgi:predicted MPP superfamily phosphohydrolase